MKKWQRVLSSGAFRGLAFCVAVLLFSYPSLTKGGEWSRQGVFLYFLCAWAAVILALLAVSLAQSARERKNIPPNGQK